MPLIRETDPLVRIDLPEPGEWVEVLPRLSRGQEIAIKQRIVRGARADDSGRVTIDPADALEAAEFARLELAVRGWSFDEPICPETLRLLDPASVTCIKAALDELYAERPADEKNA